MGVGQGSRGGLGWKAPTIAALATAIPEASGPSAGWSSSRCCRRQLPSPRRRCVAVITRCRCRRRPLRHKVRSVQRAHRGGRPEEPVVRVLVRGLDRTLADADSARCGRGGRDRTRRRQEAPGPSQRGAMHLGAARETAHTHRHPKRADHSLFTAVNSGSLALRRLRRPPSRGNVAASRSIATATTDEPCSDRRCRAATQRGIAGATLQGAPACPAAR